MLIFAIFAFFQGLTHIDLTQIGAVFGFIYCAWAIGQFFDEKKIVSYFKSLVSYLLGMITFGLFAVLAGTVADIIIRH